MTIACPEIALISDILFCKIESTLVCKVVSMVDCFVGVQAIIIVMQPNSNILFIISYDTKVAIIIIVITMERSKRQPPLFSDSKSVLPSNNPKYVPTQLSIKKTIPPISIIG